LPRLHEIYPDHYRRDLDFVGVRLCDVVLVRIVECVRGVWADILSAHFFAQESFNFEVT
jgi:hypothetical protein